MDNNEQRKMNQKMAFSFLAGLVVGGGLMWFIIGTEVLSPTINNNDNVLTESMEEKVSGGVGKLNTNTLGAQNNRLVVEDQLAGDRVLLKEVELDSASWVVVHEEVNALLGNALGAARFDKGSYTGGYVELLRNTEIGATYHVLIYKDNGDKKFNFDNDTVVTDAEGNSVGAIFEVIRLDRKTN
jgi:DNA-binding helix-hairpin-helix protein with protein kinase domain